MDRFLLMLHDANLEENDIVGDNNINYYNFLLKAGCEAQ